MAKLTNAQLSAALDAQIAENARLRADIDALTFKLAVAKCQSAAAAPTQHAASGAYATFADALTALRTAPKGSKVCRCVGGFEVRA